MTPHDPTDLLPPLDHEPDPVVALVAAWTAAGELDRFTLRR